MHHFLSWQCMVMGTKPHCQNASVDQGQGPFQDEQPLPAVEAPGALHQQEGSCNRAANDLQSLPH
jgi:hypothetical protein